jgi:hypothetical protein
VLGSELQDAAAMCVDKGDSSVPCAQRECANTTRAPVGGAAAAVKRADGSEVPCAQAAEQLTGLTLVYSARLNGVPCRVLIDTGAATSFASAAWLSRHALPVHVRSPMQVVTANNVRLALSYHAQASLRIGALQSQVVLTALPDMLPGVHVILGMDWLQQHVSTIDVRTGVCTARSSAGVCRLRPVRHVPAAVECGATRLRELRGDPQLISAARARVRVRLG